MLERGNYRAVVEILNLIPPDAPLASEAHYLRGEAFKALNIWSQAEAEYIEAVAQEPLHIDAAWALLQLYFEEERIQEARSRCADFYRRDPDRDRRVLWLIEAIRQEHERIAPAESLRLLEPVVHRDRNNRFVLRVAAQQYIRLGRLSEGIPLFQRALALNPNDQETWVLLISALYEQGEFDRLGALWEKIPPAVAADHRIRRYRGQWYEARGDLDRAIKEFEAAVKAAPRDRKALYALAQALRRKGLAHKADHYAALARQIDRAREQLGQVYLDIRARRYQPTAEQCERAAELWATMGESEQSELWQREAQARRLRNRHESAVEPASR